MRTTHRRHTYGRLAAFAALTAVAVALSACATGGPTSSPSPSATPTGPPVADATLTVGLVLEPTNLDIRHTDGSALEQLLIDNIYEGLVTRNGNEIVPRLATGYTISSDALTYTFELNKGVTFHSGATMTSADVVASFEEIRGDDSMHSHRDFAGVESIEAPDEHTVVITLTEPNVNFLFLLGGRAGLVFEEGDETDMRTAANGTGPFILDRWIQGSSVTLKRNTGYWGDPAGVAEVVFEYITEATARISTILDGSVDVLVRVDPTLLPEIADVDDLEVVEGRTSATGTLAFNLRKAPFTDIRVREAIRLAINHEALVAALGSGQTLFGPIPELDPGYQDLSELAPYDPVRAKELLVEAGFEELDLSLTIANHYPTTIARLLVSDLAKVGIQLQVNVVEFPAWLEDVFRGHNFDLSYVEHTEARDFGNFANPSYYFGYNNADVQRLYARALAQSDLDASAELLAEAARIVSSDHAADWLFAATSVNVQRQGVVGFPHDMVNARADMSRVTIVAE